MVFNYLLHNRREAATVDALIIEELDNGNFTVSRAVGWRGLILRQLVGILDYRPGSGAGLLFRLNLLQLLAGLQ